MGHALRRQRRRRTRLRGSAIARWALLLAVALLAAGCSDDKSPTGPSRTGSGGITVSVAGGGSSEFLALTQAKQLIALLTANDGSTEDVTNRVLWQSSNTSIAHVSPAGVATAIGFGSASIKAALLGRTGELPIVVKNGCLITLDPPSFVYPAGMDIYRSVSVSVLPRDCRWSAVCDASWVTLYSPQPLAVGSDSFYYHVPYNTDTSERSANVTVTASDGSTAIHSIRQEKPSCVVLLDAQSRTFPKEGGTGQFTVTPTPATCKWTASVEYSAPVRIDSGAAGEGTGTVTYTVPVNTSTYSQTFSILVQGGLPGGSIPVRHTIYQLR